MPQQPHCGSTLLPREPQDAHKPCTASRCPQPVYASSSYVYQLLGSFKMPSQPTCLSSLRVYSTASKASRCVTNSALPQKPPSLEGTPFYCFGGIRCLSRDASAKNPTQLYLNHLRKPHSVSIAGWLPQRLLPAKTDNRHTSLMLK